MESDHEELLARIAGLGRALHLETMARQGLEDRLHEVGAHMSSAASEDFEEIHWVEPASASNRLNLSAAARARVAAGSSTIEEEMADASTPMSCGLATPASSAAGSASLWRRSSNVVGVGNPRNREPVRFYIVQRTLRNYLHLLGIWVGPWTQVR